MKQRFYFPPISFLKYFGIFLLILCSILWIGSILLSSIIKDKLQKVDGLSIKEVDIAWHLQDVNIYGINYQKKEQLQIEVNQIKVHNLHWFSLLFSKKIQFDDVLVQHGNISSHQTISTSKKQTKTKEFGYTLGTHQLELVDFVFHIQHPSKKIQASLTQAQLKNLHYNNGNFSFSDFMVDANQITYQKKGGAYSIQLTKIQASKDKTILSDLQLLPSFTTQEWETKFKYKKPRTELTVPKVVLQNIHLDKLLQPKRVIELDKILLMNTLLKVEVDENKEANPTAYKPLLNELLMSCPFPLKINEITLNNNRIDIEVKSKATQKFSTIYFDSIQATLYNIQNKKNHTIRTQLSTAVLGKTNMKLEILFHTQAPLFPYEIKGSVAPFDYKIFNPFLHLNRKIRIVSGACDKLDFKIFGNNDIAQGWVAMDYQNIKMGLLEDTRVYDIKALPSFLINQLLINNNNTPKSEDHQTGTIYYVRPKNRSMYHSWWFALKSGFQSIILPDLINPKELDN
ncbi:hypothetical protein [Ochrovirga pacifica]|uniref:hypothetical protein n=1 Tax=Ochrovirga pacifica TaxID=1042376 RepID=UPI000255956D|nr:hypothetical protein [Ochrovirga pacifica]